jgi:hypothetical protein
MRVRLSKHGWPIALGLVPGNTQLDFKDWSYLNTPLPWPPPRNCVALDQQAFDALQALYPDAEIAADPYAQITRR